MDNGKLTSTIGGGSHGVISWRQNVFFLLNQVNKCQNLGFPWTIYIGMLHVHLNFVAIDS